MIFFIFLPESACAESTEAAFLDYPDWPRLSEDPQALRFAVEAEAGVPSWQFYLDLALWASGSDPADSEAAEENIQKAIRNLSSLPLPDNIMEKGEYVLEYMHEIFLQHYSERQSSIDTLLNYGTYNCVSSSVLYLILGTAAGLEIQGVVTADHAFCTVSDGAERIDVETTSPYGFNPGTKKEFHDQFGERTGFSYVPPRNYRERDPVDPVELISLILSNRIVEAENNASYAAAVEMALDRRALLRNRKLPGGHFGNPEREFTDRLLNYGTILARSREEDEALDWAAHVSTLFGMNERWESFMEAALNNLIVRHLRNQNYAAARAVLEDRTQLIGTDRVQRFSLLIHDSELIDRVRSVNTSDQAVEVAALIVDAQSKELIDDKRATEMLVFLSLGEAERIAKNQGNAAALDYLHMRSMELGSDQRLVTARQVYRSNRIAELHNTFAELYNQGLYEQAREQLLAALKEFPDEERFLYNLRLLDSTISNIGE